MTCLICLALLAILALAAPTRATGPRRQRPGSPAPRHRTPRGEIGGAVMRRLFAAFVVVAALVVATTSPGTAAAVSPSGHRHHREHHQYLVWSRFDDFKTGTARLVITRHGRVVPLTHPPAGAQDIDPRISPDGRSVLFERDLPDSQAWIVGIDGRGEHQLKLGCTAPCAGTNTPSWTPDGRHPPARLRLRPLQQQRRRGVSQPVEVRPQDTPQHTLLLPGARPHYRGDGSHLRASGLLDRPARTQRRSLGPVP